MADQTVTQADLANLAGKLDAIGAALSEKERTVLLAVFKLAGEAVAARLRARAAPVEKESGSSGWSTAAPVLSKGFKNAFQPFGAADFKVRSDVDNAAASVTIGTLI